MSRCALLIKSIKKPASCRSSLENVCKFSFVPHRINLWFEPIGLGLFGGFSRRDPGPVSVFRGGPKCVRTNFSILHNSVY